MRSAGPGGQHRDRYSDSGFSQTQAAQRSFRPGGHRRQVRTCLLTSCQPTHPCLPQPACAQTHPLNVGKGSLHPGGPGEEAAAGVDGRDVLGDGCVKALDVGLDARQLGLLGSSAGGAHLVGRRRVATEKHFFFAEECAARQPQLQYAGAFSTVHAALLPMRPPLSGVSMPTCLCNPTLVCTPATAELAPMAAKSDCPQFPSAAGWQHSPCPPAALTPGAALFSASQRSRSSSSCLSRRPASLTRCSAASSAQASFSWSNSRSISRRLLLIWYRASMTWQQGDGRWQNARQQVRRGSRMGSTCSCRERCWQRPVCGIVRTRFGQAGSPSHAPSRLLCLPP